MISVYSIHPLHNFVHLPHLFIYFCLSLCLSVCHTYTGWGGMESFKHEMGIWFSWFLASSIFILPPFLPLWQERRAAGCPSLSCQ